MMIRGVLSSVKAHERRALRSSRRVCRASICSRQAPDFVGDFSNAVACSRTGASLMVGHASAGICARRGVGLEGFSKSGKVFVASSLVVSRKASPRQAMTAYIIWHSCSVCKESRRICLKKSTSACSIAFAFEIRIARLRKRATRAAWLSVCAFALLAAGVRA